MKSEAAPIPEGTSYPDLTGKYDISVHHLVPKSKLRELIPKSWLSLSNNSEKEKYRQEIQDFVNSKHIKEVIIHKKILDRPEYLHGKAIYASILYNQYNLVKGPAGKHRANDPDYRKPNSSSIDEEILNYQRPEYQNSVKKFLDPLNSSTSKLSQWSGIPRPDPVPFTKSEKGYVTQVENFTFTFTFNQFRLFFTPGHRARRARQPPKA